MTTVSRERISPADMAVDTALSDFAESLFVGRDDFRHYDYMKAVLLGSPDPETRLAGDHPWPKRIRGEEEFTYSVPVHAGFSAVLGTGLFIGKDPWREGPDAWLVSETNLITGAGHDHEVLDVSVNRARQLWLQLAPANYGNIPRLSGGRSAYNPPRQEMIRIEGTLTPDYYLAEAEFWEGHAKPPIQFEDIVVLESMVRLLQDVKDAHDPREELARRRAAREYELWHRSLVGVVDQPIAA